METSSIKSLQLGLGWFPETPGGLERYYYGLSHGLPTVGVDVCGAVVGSKELAAAVPSVRIVPGARKDAWLPARLRGYRSATIALLNEYRPDVVASHFALYTRACLGALGDRPLVVHFQGPWAREAKMEGAGRASTWIKRNAIERAVYRRAQQVITLSEPFKDIVCQDYGVDRDRVTTIPGAISVADYEVVQSRREARAILGWPTDRPIVLAVRRLVARMGLEELIEAASTLRKAQPDVLVLIAGRGRLAEALETRIRSSGLADHVRLLGFVPDAQLPLAYRAADLTIVPSLALEGFGLVAAESLAAGTPSLVAPVGGLPQIVRELSADLILPEVTCRAVAERVRSLLKGELDLPSAARCRAHVTRFDWQHVLPQIKRVYLKALGRDAR